MNYTEITNAAIAYADRQDIEVASNIDTFLLLVESRINRLLKTRKQSARATTVTVKGQSYYLLPPDYAGMRDIQLNVTSSDESISVASFSYLSPEQMNKQSNKAYSGEHFYTIIANQFQVYPASSDGNTIELVYYQRVPALTSEEDEDENWISTDHPDIYISGLISEIESFTKNYQVADGWDGKMSRSISELDNTDVEERWSGVALVTRVES